MTESPQQKTKMTAEEYRALPETMERMEFMNGEIIVQDNSEDNTMSPSPYDRHQKAITQLIMVIGRLMDGGELRTAPIDVILDNEITVQPDVFWIAPDNTNCQLKDNYWYGAPDLCVEVLSPSTAQRDKGEKYDLYERYGVREYWIIDPANQLMEVYSLKDGAFTRFGVYDKSKTFDSPVLGEATVHVSKILV